MKTRIWFSLVFFAVFLSCQNTQNRENVDVDSLSTSRNKAVNEVKKIVYPMPTPFEISRMLKDAKAPYILDVLNFSKNVASYFTEKSRALNLGVYGADLSYAATYNKTKETEEFFKVSKELTDEIGISTAFSRTLLERVENNINQKDSLHKIITDSYYDTFEFLNDNGKGAISILIITGGWVEGLYLALQVSDVAQGNAEILAGIAQQKSVLNSLLRLLDMYAANRDIIDVKQDILKLKKEFEDVLPEKSSAISREKLVRLMQITGEVRKKIIQMR